MIEYFVVFYFNKIFNESLFLRNEYVFKRKMALSFIVILTVHVKVRELHHLFKGTSLVSAHRCLHIIKKSLQLRIFE